MQSEDNGQGGRRKKKGLKEKIKEKFTGGKHKNEEPHHQAHVLELEPQQLLQLLQSMRRRV